MKRPSGQGLKKYIYTKINKINTFFNEKDKQTNGKKSELYVDRVTLDSFKD